MYDPNILVADIALALLDRRIEQLGVGDYMLATRVAYNTIAEYLRETHDYHLPKPDANRLVAIAVTVEERRNRDRRNHHRLFP